MSTNQTTNYELNQWLSTDQVVRTDFNADNAKIDAALAALAEQVGLRTLLDETMTTPTESVDLSLAEIDWSQWRTIYVRLFPVISGGNSYCIGYRVPGGTRYNCIGTSVQKDTFLLSYPLYSGESLFHGLVFSSECQYFGLSRTFSQVEAFSIYTNISGAQFAAGSRFLIQGER